jgi:ParB-like chromosome segregation protein Spo0J
MNQRFKDIIRPLSESELQLLEQNILRDGIRDPLVVWGDTLIDGHNRYAIAQAVQADITPKGGEPG